MRTSRKAWKLLDSWVSTPDLEPRVLTRLEGRPQERNLLHIGEVCSWYLYEWVSPVQQVALANPLVTHSRSILASQYQMPHRPGIPEKPAEDNSSSVSHLGTYLYRGENRA